MRIAGGPLHEPALVDFPFDGAHGSFFNINTPEDLARAEQMAKMVK